MSALLLLFHRDGEPVAGELFDQMLATLNHRGVAGSDVRRHTAVAIGHQHSWTTPEEVGERQPLSDEPAQIDLVFDGRLDNREEIAAALRLESHVWREMSDAALVLRAYCHWDENCFEKFVGPFAVCVYDHRRQRVVCARDPLGRRALYFYLDERRLIVASEEQAILAHPRVSRELNESRLALYFALRHPEDGATFFRSVEALLPAHLLVVEPDHTYQRRYWDVDPEHQIRYRSDSEYADHFRELLLQSVRRRLRATTDIGVMMSGGLDSTSVTLLAAQEMKFVGDPRNLYAISWIFDELAACDERLYMDPVLDRAGATPVHFSGDHAWPLHPGHPWPHNPNQPGVNAYYLLFAGVHQHARANRVGVVLGGAYGDHLYSGAIEWLADVWRDYGLWQAAREIGDLVRQFGLVSTARSRSLRRFARRYMQRFGFTMEFWPQAAPPPWLTAAARRLLPSEQVWSPSARFTRNPEAHRVLLRLPSGNGAGASDVQFRFPYRDRNLIEYVLAIPGHQLYRNGRLKHILRNALEGILPEAVRQRPQSTALTPLYARGLFERERHKIDTMLNAAEVEWPRYVERKWLTNSMRANTGGLGDQTQQLLPWFCLCFEQWRCHYNRHERKNDR
jgi:asparagine synthase (glutamine-hydrolysing)